MDRPDRQQSFRALVDVLSKTIALLIGLLYVSGFLVVELYLSNYGITEYGLLKPHIFAAGALFLILFAVPFEAVRHFNFLKLGHDHVTTLPAKQERWLRLSLRLLAFLWACAVTTWPLSLWLIVPNPGPPRTKVELWLVIGALGFVGGVIEATSAQFHRKPKRCAALAILTFILLNIVDAGFIRQPLVYWFFFVGAFIALVYPRMSDREQLPKYQWHSLLGTILSALVLYSLVVYPQLKPSLGGGAPTPVLVHLRQKNPAIRDGSLVWLLDETDTGLYLKRSRDAHAASFLPREYIALLEFEGQVQ